VTKIAKQLCSQYVKNKRVIYGYVYICILDVLSVIQVLILKMLQSNKIFLNIYKIFENF
jgi:hypothetical protein